jgi:uncharacterized protein (TIGR02757 family)
MLSKRRAERLGPLLVSLVDRREVHERIRFDPVEFPRRYAEKRDIEVVGLLSTALAYGRADVFRPKIASILEHLGPSPAAWVEAATVSRVARVVDGFVYRFNVPADLAVLLLGMGATLRTHGSLESVFVQGLEREGEFRKALAAFSRSILDAAPTEAIVRRLGSVRGLAHLLPTGNGTSKRLSLYLRWMVRGPDAVDFGIWKRIAPSKLVIPLDTHIARLSSWLGLTSRKTQSWAMAEEITDSLRLVDVDDPVRFDFALCHYGMSGACPTTPIRANCARCVLRSECQHGRRLSR